MLTVALVFIALVTALVGYVVFIRPYLERRGWVIQAPADVASARDRLGASVRHSLTVLWGQLMVLFGAAWELTLKIAEAMQDPELKGQLLGLGLGEWFGIALAALGIITIVVRLRTAKASD